MKSAESMRQDWDERARKDAFFYIASWRKEWNEDAFFQSGEDDFCHLVSRVLDRHGFSPENKSMLEVGCGVGRMTRAFAHKFQSVTAVDLSSEMLSRARALNSNFHNIGWVQGNGSDLQPVPDASVDFVFSYLVLQHLPNKQLNAAYISEMFRVLSSGGLCLFQFNGTANSNMNWKGRVIWSFIDALWVLRLRPLVSIVCRLLGLDSEMAGSNWHGVALSSVEIARAVRAGGGEPLEMFGENSPMAWCCARKQAA